VLTATRPAFELLETLRHDPGDGFRHLEEHLARLGSSARYFGFRCDREAVLAELERAIAGRGPVAIRVRLALDRDGSLSTDAAELAEPDDRPVRIALDDEPVDPSDVWLFHKTTRRGPYDRRRARRPDVEDVVLVNRHGEATESTIANLAVRGEDDWVTPPVAAGLLPGCYRAVLVREGALVERPLTIEELRRAREVALISSVRGWRAAELVP
jgi:para-aminobenzoate synthetase/4-amino-4-deoxychorismate lyase